MRPNKSTSKCLWHSCICKSPVSVLSPSRQQAPLISRTNRSLLRAEGHEHQLIISYSWQLDGSLITVLRIQAWRHGSKLNPCRTVHPGQILLSPPLSPMQKGRLKIGVTGSQVPLLQADSKAQSSLQTARTSFSQGLGSLRELSFPRLTWPSPWEAALRAEYRSWTSANAFSFPRCDAYDQKT